MQHAPLSLVIAIVPLVLILQEHVQAVATSFTCLLLELVQVHAQLVPIAPTVIPVPLLVLEPHVLLVLLVTMLPPVEVVFYAMMPLLIPTANIVLQLKHVPLVMMVTT